MKIPTGHASIESSNRSPLASTLLARRIKNLGNQRLAIIIVELQDVGGDLNEEGVEDTLVPGVEDVRNLVLGEAETTLEDVVGFSDQLHVTVFDTLCPWNVRNRKGNDMRV